MTGGLTASEQLQTASEQLQIGQIKHVAHHKTKIWTSAYLLQAGAVDACSALVAGLLAFEARFGGNSYKASTYFWLGLALPAIWLITLKLVGAYDVRLIGLGSDEFRAVLNAGIFLTAAVAIAAYASKTEVARGYVVLALPSLTALDLLARFQLRKRLHRNRTRGNCMRRLVVVGYPDVVAELDSDAGPGCLPRAFGRGGLRRRSRSADLHQGSSGGRWTRQHR